VGLGRCGATEEEVLEKEKRGPQKPDRELDGRKQRSLSYDECSRGRTIGSRAPVCWSLLLARTRALMLVQQVISRNNFETS
jgi:hypothetical protein